MQPRSMDNDWGMLIYPIVLDSLIFGWMRFYTIVLNIQIAIIYSFVWKRNLVILNVPFGLKVWQWPLRVYLFLGVLLYEQSYLLFNFRVLPPTNTYTYQLVKTHLCITIVSEQFLVTPNRYIRVTTFQGLFILGIVNEHLTYVSQKKILIFKNQI